MEKKQRVKQCLLWSAIVIGSLLLVQLPMFIMGKFQIWWIDGATQHYTFLRQFGEQKLLFNLGGIDTVGLIGCDQLISYLYYGLFDPFSLLFYIFPSGMSAFTYTIMVELKFIGTALILYFYLRHKKVSFTTATISSMIYMLSGYGMTMIARHPMLASGMMYLPLLIWGLENLIDKRRGYIYLIASVLILASNFYMYYMCMLFAVLYAIFYYIESYYEKGKPFFTKSLWLTILKVALYTFLSIGLCLVFLLPMVYGYTTSARGESKGVALPVLNTYLQIMIGFIFPINAQDFNVIGLPILCSICFAVYLKFGKNKTYRSLSLILLLGLFVPLFGYGMNAFTYVSGRWFFLLIFVIVVSTSFEIDNHLQFGWGQEKINYIVKILLSFGIILFTFATMVVSASYFGKANTASFIQILVYIGITLIGLCMLLCIYKVKLKMFSLKFSKRTIIIAMLTLSIGAGLIYNIYYGKQFSTRLELEERLTSTQEQLVADAYQDGFFRTDVHTQNTKHYFDGYHNNGIYNGYASTNGYNTISNQYVYEYLQSIGFAGYMHTLGMGGLQGSLASNTMLSTKYYISENVQPYGYTKIGDNLFENEKFLPLGYVYHKTMSTSFYESLPIEERAIAMLDACVIDKTSNYVYTQKTNRVRYESVLKNVIIENNQIIADKNATIQLFLNDQTDAELTLYLKNFVPVSRTQVNNWVDAKVVKYVEVTTTNQYYKQNLYEKGSQMYSGVKDFAFTLGSDEINVVTISLQEGKYRFDDIAIYAYNHHDYDTTFYNQKEYMTNVSITNQEVSGQLNTTGGTFFLSLPYSSGWTAYVDGNKVDIKRANIGYMAIDVKSGKHTITFKYQTPLLKTGVTCSTVFLGVLGIIIVFDIVYTIQKRRKQVGKENNKKSNN